MEPAATGSSRFKGKPFTVGRPAGWAILLAGPHLTRLAAVDTHHQHRPPVTRGAVDKCDLARLRQSACEGTNQRR